MRIAFRDYDLMPEVVGAGEGGRATNKPITIWEPPGAVGPVIWLRGK